MKCISDAKSEEAFDLAMEHFPVLSKELVVLNGKYVRLKKKHNAGALSQERYNEGVAEISYGLIDLITGKEDDKLPDVKKVNPIRRLISYQVKFLNTFLIIPYHPNPASLYQILLNDIHYSV